MIRIKQFSSSCKAIIAITAMFMAVVCVWAAIEQWHKAQLQDSTQNIANTELHILSEK